MDATQYEAPFVIHGGPGYGFSVARLVRSDGLVNTVVLSGPYTLKEQAEAEAKRIATQDEARRMGRERGEAAASWYFDGNTTREQYARVLGGIEDGDPEVMDALPSSPLSGEWADDPLPGDILRALGVDEYDEQNDNYLAVYEDGFAEASLQAIEREAREHLAADDDDDADEDADDDDDEPSVRELARQVCGRMTRRTRDDGSQFVTLTDAADEWMRDLCRHAHGDMLPDDWRYDCIYAALEAIADADDPADVADEFADGYVDVYSSALVEWFASHGNREGYVQEAREEWGASADSIYEDIRRGQFMEAREVYELVLRGLEKEV